jgi:low temperature requirement protein LtrA
MQNIMLRSDRHHKQRKVSWLELFFDLVFVVIIARIAHNFLSDISWSGFGTFIFMFLSVWWMWRSVIYFTERFASTERVQRIYTFLMMIPVVGMTLFTHHGFGENYPGFAISYLISRVIFFGMIFYAALKIKEYISVGIGFMAFTSIAIVLVTGSLFVGENIRLILWGAAILMELLGPVLTVNQQVRLPANVNSSAVDERYGLLTIIVVGEVIASTANTLADGHQITSQLLLNGLLALWIGFAIWAMYFDSVSERALPDKPEDGLKMAGWVYAHIFLNIAIISSAIGIATVVLGEAVFAEKILLSSSIGFVMIFVSLIEVTLNEEEKSNSRSSASPVFAGIFFGIVTILIPFIIQISNITLYLLTLSFIIVLRHMYGYFLKNRMR